MSDASHLRAPRLFGRRVFAAAVVVFGLGGTLPLGAEAAVATAPRSPSSAVAALVAPHDVGDGIDGQVTAEIVVHDSGVVEAGEPLRVTVVLSNRTETAVGAGELSFHIDEDTIDTRYDLGEWTAVDTSPPSSTLGTPTLRESAPEVQPGSTVEVPLSLPASSTASLQAEPFGARGITVQWDADGAVKAEARSTFVWNAESLASPVEISPVVPIVTALGSGGLLTAPELESLTAPDGDLTLLLDAVEGTAATLAIDPRLLVSIRALGADAPQSATAWLDRLESLKNTSFPLEFADASLTLQSQAGLEEPIRPTGFTYATAEHDFFTEVPASPSPSPSPSPAGTDPSGPPMPSTPGESEGAQSDPAEAQPEIAQPAESATVAPTSPTQTPETAPEGTVLEPRLAPNRDELLEFDYTRPDVTWPDAGTVDDVGALSAWGAGSIILDGNQATHSPDRSSTPSSQQQISGTEVLVTDTALDAAIANAVTAEDDLDFMDATTNVATLLAVIARELPNEARQIVTTLPRDALQDPDRLDSLLAQMGQNGWTTIDPLPDRADAPGALNATELVPASYSAESIEQFQALLTALDRGVDLSALYANPAAVVEEMRVDLIGTIRNPIIATEQWETERRDFIESATAVASEISIVEGSEIQLIGHEGSLPLFIENSSERDVTVELRLRPTTGHLTVTEAAVVTIPAGGVTRATLPVQAIANGVSGVEATLWTVTGIQLENSSELVVNVNASLETVAVVVLLGAGALLFVVGIWRTLRRKKRDKSAKMTESSDDAASDEESAANESGTPGSTGDSDESESSAHH